MFLTMLSKTVNNAATAATNTNPFAAAAGPVITLLNQVLGPAIAIVAALGAIWCILLGVKLAKADEPQEKEKAKSALKNAIVGYLLIFILIVVLRLSLTPMINWVNDSTKNSEYKTDLSMPDTSSSKS